MRAYEVQTRGGIDDLRRVERPDPRPPKVGEVLVAMRAASLNYRDLGIVRGGYLRNDTRPVIPLSDGAGEVIAVGEGVSEWAAGDRVVGSFVQDWTAGPPTDAALRTSLGGGIDGVLCERRLFPVASLARVPASFSYAEAACLPCAGLTAFHGLGFDLHGRGDDVGRGGEDGLGDRWAVTADQTVLTLGTGGVSIFALQIARAVGARVIVTSSSDEKLSRAAELGASDTVNYETHPEWDALVRDLTGGQGVDHVIEVGGPGTLARSIACTRVGGQIALIGVLAGADGRPDLMPAVFNCLRINGIYVGSSRMLRRFVGFCEEHAIRPVVDRTFAFEEAADAYRHLKSGQHFGKVTIDISG